MITKEIKIRIGDLLNGFTLTDYYDETDKGVFTNVNLDGTIVKLNIRPKYQRNFIYDLKKQQAVIDSIMRGYPLNKMYWYKTNVNGDVSYGILDGQQRTLSILLYSKGKFSVTYNNIAVGINTKSYEVNEPPCRKYGETFKDAFLNYPLDICLCEEEQVGDREQWFERINTSNVSLTKQELRNANYSSNWLDDAKYYFSRKSWETGIPTSQEVCDYMKGVKDDDIARQSCLEKAIDWICKRDKIKPDGERDAISVYMGNCRDNSLENAKKLVEYAENIVNFAKKVFPNYHHFKNIKDADWQYLYETYKDKEYVAEELEKEYDEVKKALEIEHSKDNSFKIDYVGIFEYLLSKHEKINCLNARMFTDDANKQTKYDEQKGICPRCGRKFEINEMEQDHILSYINGGKTCYVNLQLLCKSCNTSKGGK